MAVDVKRLCRPEHDDGEKVSTRDECDDQRQAKSARLLLQPTWEDRVFGAVDFPKAKGNQEGEAEDERYKDMGGCPVVL